MYKIKTTFLQNSFFGGCGVASNRHAFVYKRINDLPVSISWGLCTAYLNDFDPNAGQLGTYKVDGRTVATVVDAMAPLLRPKVINLRLR
jgi:hypothetical protein